MEYLGHQSVTIDAENRILTVGARVIPWADVKSVDFRIVEQAAFMHPLKKAVTWVLLCSRLGRWLGLYPPTERLRRLVVAACNRPVITRLEHHINLQNEIVVLTLLRGHYFSHHPQLKAMVQDSAVCLAQLQRVVER